MCTQDEAVNEIDKNEIRAEAEQTTIKFIELARQMEAFFLQKRFLLSALKPELIVKEDINDLRAELIRKEDLIKRHYEKISVWQNILADLQGYSKSPAAASQQQPPQQNAIINADPLTVPSPLVSGSGGQIPGPGTGQFSQQQQQLALQQQQHQQLQQQIQVFGNYKTTQRTRKYFKVQFFKIFFQK